MARDTRAQFLAGVKAGIPVVVGFIPIGIAYGIMARQAGLTALESVSMSAMVFAGASQMLAAGMYGQGAGILAIVLATFILNLRHLIMSTCVMNRLRGAGMGLRLLAAFGVTDESFAIFTTTGGENCTMPFFLGLISSTYLAWNAGSLIGAVASAILPEILAASLGVSLYAMFIGLLTPNLRGNWRLCALAALTALCNTLLRRIMPESWALICATLLCAFIGVYFVELEEEPGEAANES